MTRNLLFVFLILGIFTLVVSEEKITAKTYFDITIDGEKAGNIVFDLFGDVVLKQF